MKTQKRIYSKRTSLKGMSEEEKRIHRLKLASIASKRPERRRRWAEYYEKNKHDSSFIGELCQEK